MSFGDRMLDNALDRWLTTEPDRCECEQKCTCDDDDDDDGLELCSCGHEAFRHTSGTGLCGVKFEKCACTEFRTQVSV